MSRGPATIVAFSVILWFGLLSMRVEARWALTVFELLVFGLAGAMIVQRRFAIGVHPAALLLAAVAVWGVVQLALGTSVNPARTVEAVLGWVVNVAVFSIALALPGGRVEKDRFLQIQLAFAVVLSVGAVIGLLTVSELGPFAYKNQFAAYGESLLGIALYNALRDSRRSLAWLLAAAALFACVVAAGSRAGSILCLAEWIVLPLIAFARGWISKSALLRTGAAALLFGGIAIAVAGWETTWQRLQEPHPYSLRADLLRSSLEMARERPLAGFGLGTWSTAYPGYAHYDDGTFVNQAHNDWAQWTVEGGLPLLAVMAAVVVFLAKAAFDSLWGLGLLAVFIHAWVDYPFQQRPALAAFFFALAGVLAARAQATSSEAGYRPDESSPAAFPAENSLRED